MIRFRLMRGKITIGSLVMDCALARFPREEEGNEVGVFVGIRKVVRVVTGCGPRDNASFGFGEVSVEDGRRETADELALSGGCDDFGFGERTATSPGVTKGQGEKGFEGFGWIGGGSGNRCDGPVVVDVFEFIYCKLLR